jgi:hypothetical protein
LPQLRRGAPTRLGSTAVARRSIAILGAVSTIAIILLVLLGLLALLFVGGVIAARRHANETSGRLLLKIQAADRALEAARAADRGWDRVLLDEAARAAIELERPGFRYDALHLVLVEDRPGTEEDRAQLAAVGEEGELRVVLSRHGDGWVAESVA